MAAPKGLLVIPIGFNPSGDIRAVTVSADDYLNVALETGLTGGGMGEPEGRIVTMCGYDPDGNLRAIEMDANDNVLMSLLGGSVNQILVSDGTKFMAETLANLIEAAILTADGDILIRSGGVAQRLAKPSVGQILGESGQIPAWITKPTTAYTQGARAYNNANQAIPHASATVLALNSERYDTDNIHDNVTNNNRLTCKTAGIYLICAMVYWGSQTAGFRSLVINLIGTGYIAASTMNPSVSGNRAQAFSFMYQLAVNDAIEIQAYQTSGAAMDILYTGGYSPEFMMSRVG